MRRIIRALEHAIKNMLMKKSAKQKPGITKHRDDTFVECKGDAIKSAAKATSEKQKDEKVLAIHTANDKIEYLYAWEKNQSLKNHFKDNVKALNRGVDIKRIFIINKEDVLDDNGIHFINHDAYKIIKDHNDAGIKVFVVFEDDVEERDDIKDISLFTGDSIQIHEHVEGNGNCDYGKARISKDLQTIECYTKIFDGLKNCGLAFEEFFKKYPLKNLENEKVPGEENFIRENV